MPDNTENLQKYRDNLDSIDNSIQALIIKRALYVHKIAMSKSTTFPLSIRPNREADIMHRLHNNHSGDFPFTALHRMWAEMINAFTLLQSNYTIALYTPSHSTDTITPFHYWDIARNHFGSCIYHPLYFYTRGHTPSRNRTQYYCHRSCLWFVFSS